ncbi:MAG: hypothetical protein ABIH72_05760 [archaeon]
MNIENLNLDPWELKKALEPLGYIFPDRFTFKTRTSGKFDSDGEVYITNADMQLQSFMIYRKRGNENIGFKVIPHSIYEKNSNPRLIKTLIPFPDELVKELELILEKK